MKVKCGARFTLHARFQVSVGKKVRAQSIVLYRELAQTVTKGRKALGVDQNNVSTLRRRVEAGKRNKKGLLAMHTNARDPVRRPSIAAAKRGKQMVTVVLAGPADWGARVA